MRSIKKVKSLDHYGCAIACLAMITNKSYFQMREKLNQVYDRHKYKITSFERLGIPVSDVYELLRTHLNVRCQGTKFIMPMEKHCILLINPIDPYLAQKFLHAIVWDAKRKRILDPDGNDNSILDNFNICCCIEILQPKKGLESESEYWRFNGVGPRVRLKQDEIECVLEDLLFGRFDKPTKFQIISRLTKATGLTKEQIKKALLKHISDKNTVNCV